MKVTLLKNIRYKNTSHKAGEEIVINKTDLEDFIQSGVIEKVEDEDQLKESKTKSKDE